MKMTFVKSQPEAKNIRTFYFKPQTLLDYTAGQYIELYLPHDRADKRGHKRWFTLSSSPKDELLTITTKFSQPSSSFKKALASLESGRELKFIGPMGDFVLPKIIQTPLVFIAGGIGITPFHSILSWLDQVSENRPIKLIYALKNEDEIVFDELLNKLTPNLYYVIEQPSDSWGGERGRLSAELIMGLSNINKDSLVYISGPEGLVESLGKDLVKKAVDKRQIIQDFFPNYSSI